MDRWTDEWWMDQAYNYELPLLTLRISIWISKLANSSSSEKWFLSETDRYPVLRQGIGMTAWARSTGSPNTSRSCITNRSRVHSGLLTSKSNFDSQTGLYPFVSIVGGVWDMWQCDMGECEIVWECETWGMGQCYGSVIWESVRYECKVVWNSVIWECEMWDEVWDSVIWESVRCEYEVWASVNVRYGTVCDKQVWIIKECVWYGTGVEV